MTTLTSANSSFALAIAGLIATPQTLKGYAADAMFETEALENAELVFGADGTLSAGYVFNATMQTITLMPNSPSLSLFEDWRNAETVAQDKYIAAAIITLPAVGRKYTLTNGYLRSMPPVIGAARILQPVAIQIAWGLVVGERTS